MRELTNYGNKAFNVQQNFEKEAHTMEVRVELLKQNSEREKQARLEVENGHKVIEEQFNKKVEKIKKLE